MRIQPEHAFHSKSSKHFNMDDEGAAGSFTILDLQLSKKTPKLSCRLETILSHKVITKLIEQTMKIRQYLGMN